VEADRSVMALCRELLAVTSCTGCEVGGSLTGSYRVQIVLCCPLLTGQTVGNRRAVFSQGRAIRRMWKRIRWNESGVLRYDRLMCLTL
jgi:hypothetical protein